jgi:hypothetical protein
VTDRPDDTGSETHEKRAEELILEVYRQRGALAVDGRRATRVVMNPASYRTIQRYHAMLGEMPEGTPDYIDRYRLFDLEICIEDVADPIVE